MTSASAGLGKPIAFDAADGSITIDGLTSKIGYQLQVSELPSDLLAMINSQHDMGISWMWTNLGGTALDANPCTLSLGFFMNTRQKSPGWCASRGRTTQAAGPGQTPSPRRSIS
jgi:hypothetical protein